VNAPGDDAAERDAVGEAVGGGEPDFLDAAAGLEGLEDPRSPPPISRAPCARPRSSSTRCSRWWKANSVVAIRRPKKPYEDHRKEFTVHAPMPGAFDYFDRAAMAALAQWFREAS